MAPMVKTRNLLKALLYRRSLILTVGDPRAFPSLPRRGQGRLLQIPPLTPPSKGGGFFPLKGTLTPLTKRHRQWPLVLLAGIFFACRPTTAGAEQCVMAGKHNEREVLVNRCETCQIVTLTHKRPGPDPAVTRKYTVPGKSSTDLSFRGPGLTRIQSVAPCVAPPPPPPPPPPANQGQKSAPVPGRHGGGP